MNDETTEKLLLNLQAECLLASANCATVNFTFYKASFNLATALDVKKNAAEVLRAMYGKVDAIKDKVATEFRNILNESNSETLERVKNWLAGEETTANKANSFLDRFELIADSRKKIDVVLERLGKVESFLRKKKDETLFSGDWKLDEINKEIERARSASKELENLIEEREEE